MALKDLLVQVDMSKAGEHRVDYALALAEAHGAHVIGVALSPIAGLPFASGYDLGAPPPIEYFQAFAKEAQKALDGFSDKGRKLGVALETRLIEGAGIEFPRRLAIHARHVDLTVVGQPDSRDQSGDQLALLEGLLVNTGRPLLVVPYIGAPSRPPKTVLVAWDGSPTAARAVNDAMPLITAADAVIVFVAEAERRGEAHGAEPGADIALHLARHGAKAEVSRVESSDIDIGNLLLSRAADHNADLIVMGGYHHSRLREYLLGGVTRTVIEEMTVPVLMAH